MSLFGSLFTGVSALNAQSQSLSVIANNIANVNTTGYKRLVADFSDLVVQGDRNAVYSSGGVRSNTNSTLEQQGSLNQTGSATDIGLSGAGFFVVKSAPGSTGNFYTRAGSFALDNQGYLKNSAGYYLVGQPYSATGTLGPNQTLQLNTIGAKLKATTTAAISANLDATQDPLAPTDHFTRTLRVFDTLGGPQDLQLRFSKTAASPPTWTMDIDAPTTPVTTQNLTLGFDPTTGAIDPLVTPATTIAFTVPDWGYGAGQTINIDISKITQYSSPYDVNYATQDGVQVGGFRGVSIDNNGDVIANFTNGLTEKVAKLPVALFANANAMNAKSGNVYEETIASGQANLKASGSGGAGTVASSSLEQSNVDLAEEFSRMIVTQRAYSAGTKVISTSNDMLQELLNIR